VLWNSISTIAQNRQPDSLRNKQLAYNKSRQEESERKKKEAAEAYAKKNNGAKQGAVVVSYDSKGNKVESTSSTNKNGERVTTTTITLPPILNRKFNLDTINLDSIHIKVLKSKHRLQVYHKGKILTAYKCVFGPKPHLQKQCEGDRCTPEGTFTIQSIKNHEKWDKFMLFDYPNEDSKRLFEENKAKGNIPSHARIGGLVGIHGIWHNGDNVIDLKHNWTDGCVSIKNKDIEELETIVKPGVTKITIVK
jgi:murein L,D-transpeptidase YafK